MRKRIIILLTAGLVAGILSGCTGKKEATVTQKEPALTENTVEEPSEEESTEKESAASEEPAEEQEEATPDNSWVNSYIDYLKTVDEFDYQSASLIYVDEDDIPEIALEGNGHYLGSIVLTIGNDNSVKEHFFGSNGNVQNLLHDFNPGGGGADDDITCIENGEWKTLFFGEYETIPDPDSDDFIGDNYQIFDNGYWEEGEGRNVSEEEYNNAMDSIFENKGYEEDKSETIAFPYTRDELIEELKKIL